MQPLFFQLVYGNTPTQAGIKTMPQIGALIPVSIIIGLITSKYGIYVPFPKVGLAIMAVGIGLCATWTATTPLGVQMAFMVIMGVGAGLTLSVLMVAVQANLPVADIGPGTTAATFTQTIGGVLGIAVAGAIMQTVTGAEITPEAIGGIAMTYNADPMELGAAIRGIVDGRPIVPTPTLPQAAIYAALALIQNAYVSGLTKAFISVAAASAVGWLVFLPVRHTALRTTMDNKGESKDEEVLSDEELKLEDIVVEDTKTVVDGEVPRAVEAEVAKN